MPLPPALQARLQKRGILKDGPTASGVPSGSVSVRANSLITSTSTKSLHYTPVEPGSKPSCPGCPNKCNPYHVCVDYCRMKWGTGYMEPEKYTEKKRQLMLLKYPKPPGWKEIYDPGTGRHYYWNVDTDEVSWLPPEHPKASVTVSANKLRAILAKTDFRPTAEVAKYLYKNATCVTTLINEFTNDPPEPSSSQEDEDMRQQFEKEYGSQQQRGRGGKVGRRRGNSDKDPLDPMDPASYSDVPRGGWGVGLETGGEAKTGVDVTASGPLFQSRPYPSPGSILRRNAGIVDKKK